MKLLLAQTVPLLMAILKVAQALSVPVAIEHPETSTTNVSHSADATELQAPGTAETLKALTIAQCPNPAYGVPLLRAWNPRATDHFYTTNSAEMDYAVANFGYTAEGTTGYVFSNQQPGSIPLYRLWNPSASDHFYTISAVERDNAINRYGYGSEGVAGYVYPDPACGGLPLYRSYNGQIGDHFYTMSAIEKDKAIKGGWG
ncbi:hypothetical protein LshimejAT787_1600630 [Lyophyllum shimeji]|uniref:DUF5648 domain-containing protein n=1 Tax=Lyophyllum shimeji TaxID=47721 RepID=A0A9P3PYZ4_LYOSH|nr:hypothetical protein LshimejAT787_1600630 [Lyophyllum shimeji]